MILSECWLHQLPLKRLGCKWVVCTRDQQARQLVHPTVKALGRVWAFNGQWAGTHGGSHSTLKGASQGVESDVAKAIFDDLSRLDEALGGIENITAVSHLTLRAIEVGMEEAIVMGLGTALADCPAGHQVPILKGRGLPDGCVVGFLKAQEVVGVAKPSIPETIKARLRHARDLGVPKTAGGIALPLAENRRYSSLAELLSACEADAAQCVAKMGITRLSRGGS